MTVKKTESENNGPNESPLKSFANGKTHRSEKPDPNDVPWTPEWYEELYRLEAEAGGALAGSPAQVEQMIQRDSTRRYESAKHALKAAFLRSVGSIALGRRDSPYEAYCSSVSDNLLEGVPFDELRQAFDDGKGQELRGDAQHPPKMAAMYSSSALALNTFGPWYKNLDQLMVNGHIGFDEMAFEAQVPTGLNGTPPHLDVCLRTEDRTLAIESKCLEYLRIKPAEFKPAYDTISDERRTSAWYRHIDLLRKDSRHYHYLDAAQLIKHYLGLAHIRPTRSITLLYLFWEPVNWKDFSAFTFHRDEISRFGEVVAGDRIHFEAMSYDELWKGWEDRTSPPWLATHVQRLISRYRVELTD